MSDSQLATKQQEPSVALMLQTMVERGITGESVEAFSKLMELHERMQDRQAQRDFAVAFNALQGEMPKVKATKAVPGNNGEVRYRFAPFEEIMDQAQPFLMKHGFTVKFDNEYDANNRVICLCKLTHISGHSETNKFAVRISPPPKSSDAQADGSSSSYAKRFALCNALNIRVEGMDDDAKLAGGPIDAETSDALCQRVALLKKKTKFDEETFFKLAGAVTYETIPQTKYELLDATLFDLERKANIRDAQGEWILFKK